MELIIGGFFILVLLLFMLVPLLYMPRFFRDMPKDKGGEWVACSIRTTPFSRREVRTVKVKGLRRAYLASRLISLLEDWKTPYGEGEIGIVWAVRKAGEPQEDDCA